MQLAEGAPRMLWGMPQAPQGKHSLYSTPECCVTLASLLSALISQNCTQCYTGGTDLRTRLRCASRGD